MGNTKICVHGNSGHLQDRSAISYATGWGIEYDVAGTGSWVQYSIPLESGTTITKIEVQFSKSGQHYKNGWIRHVHIYDGGYLRERLDDVYLGKDSASKTTTSELDLKAPTKIGSGLGVSILPETKVAGGLKAIVNFEIHSVCATVG